MKIEFLTAATEPWGAENSLFLIAEELLRNGHEVRIVTRSEVVEEFFRPLHGAQVVSLRHEGGRLSTLRVFADFLRTSRSSADWVAVVFSVDLAPLAAVDRLCIHARSTWVYDVHDTPAKALTRLILAVSLMPYDLAICISKYARMWGLGARRRKIVPRPIPLPGDTPRLTRGMPVVGVIGRLHPDKNLAFAVDAFKAVSDRMRFAFIGAAFGASQGYADELCHLANKELKCGAEFPGRLEVDEAFARIDVLFVANGAEPSGRTVGEAMIRGIPVVVPDSGGSVEYVQGTTAGFIYERNNIGSASACLAQLTEFQTRTDMGVQGRASILEHRTPQIVADGYIEAINKARGKEVVGR